MIYLFYLIAFVFFCISFLEFKKGVQLFIFIRLFIPSSMALVNAPNLPPISFERILMFVLVLMYVKYLIEKQSKKRELNYFPYNSLIFY